MDAAARALLRGDVEAFARAIGALGPPVGPLRRRIFETLVPIAARAGEWARAHGFAGPDKHRDRQFDRCVLPRLPDDLRRTPEFVQACAKVWADVAARAKVAPSLAAYAAVYKALENDLVRTLTASDLVDARHAVYAPWADVFTCDRRNDAALRRALASATSRPRIVRCAQLAQVAAIAKQIATTERQ
jgi:hypothetical protein